MPCITCMKMLLSVKPKWMFFESDYDIKNIQWILDNEKHCHIVKVSLDEYDNFDYQYLTFLFPLERFIYESFYTRQVSSINVK